MNPWYYDMCQEGHIRAVAKEARQLFQMYKNDGDSNTQAQARVRRSIIQAYGLGVEGWTEMGLTRAFSRNYRPPVQQYRRERRGRR